LESGNATVGDRTLWFGLANARPKKQSQLRNLVIWWMSAHYVGKARLMPVQIGLRGGKESRMKWLISHLRSSGILGASVLIFASLFFSQLALGHSTQIIPPDRNFTWNPGMMSKGGIPNRITICATLSPSGGSDTAAIQAQLNSCPAGQVVLLNCRLDTGRLSGH
jgi:hypothetical protein